MKKYFFTKEEKFHLESIAAKSENLALQDKILKQEAETVISAFCKRNSIATDKPIKYKIDLNSGCMEINDLEVTEKRNKNEKRGKK